MKIIIFILVIIIAALYITSANAEPVKTCPAGSYDVGISKTNEPLCKLEPTGCPYGDSIPLDSIKCVAPVDEVKPVVLEIAPQLTIEEMSGK